jgi:hypothetical protein
MSIGAPHERQGVGAAGGGDLDGDGFDDLAFISPEGVLQVLWGDGLRTSKRELDQNAPTGRYESGIHQDVWLEETVAMVGDHNGDGLDDVAMIGYEAPAAELHLLFGQPDRRWPIGSELESGEGGRILRGSPEDQPWILLGRAGDFDGDGLHDVLASGVGGVIVLFGGPQAVPESDVEAAAGGRALRIIDEDICCSVRGGRDLDGDGRADLVIPLGGSILVVRGHPGGGNVSISALEAAGLAIRIGTEAFENGVSADVHPDADGDGRPEFVVATDGRMAFVEDIPMMGSFSLLPGSAAATWLEYAPARPGRPFGIPGDYDGDGIEDLLVRGDDATILFTDLRERLADAEAGK